MTRNWIAAAAAGVLAASACASRTPEPQPVPPPEPAPTGIVISPPPPLQGVVEDITACLVRNGRMEMTPAHFYPVTGDTTVNGRPFRDVYPVTAEYASVAQWYVDNVPITVNGYRYIKYGLPRVLLPTDVVPMGSYQGVTLFGEPDSPRTRVDVYYLPVTPDCQFQPYQGGHGGSAVRG